MTPAEPYLAEIASALPRLLALFDADPRSPSFGVGDRRWWAWKLVDFGTGTYQGAARGLASLLVSHQLPAGLGEASVLYRIGSMFQGARALRRANGSLEEAFPHESSFCVTAGVAFDLLSAVELLGDRVTTAERTVFLDVVGPMIRFLQRADEQHGFISNHLLAGAAALMKWTSLTGESAAATRGEMFLRRVMKEQSAEGWLREYQGADPGYQTLALGYLADVHRSRPDLSLEGSLEKAVEFLTYCAHPDGSFGGIYGSRNTRFYFPEGVEAVASQTSSAGALALHMRTSIARRTTVTLAAMDDMNLVPMFNAYALAAAHARPVETSTALPCADQAMTRTVMPGAGLIFDRGVAHYRIVSTHKGGVCYSFPFDGRRPMVDAGVLATDTSGQRYSTQGYDASNVVEIEADVVTVTASMSAVRDRLPTPFEHILLRLAALTVMRSTAIGNLVKRALARLLITGRKTAALRNRRTIRFGADVDITDEWVGVASGWTRLPAIEPFTAIHMASSGYWQMQDDAR